MDSEKVLEQFGNPELVPTEYIDSLLPKYRHGEKLDGLHSQASDLLSTLDHHSQDLTMQLEQLTAELLRASKKVSYEVELLKSDVDGLVVSVDSVDKNSIQKLKSQQDVTVDRLKRLDVVKSRMSDVQAVFDEAKQFDRAKITQKIEQLVTNEDEKEARAELDRLSELILVWKGTSEYPSKQKFINSLKKRVETMVQQRDERSRANTPTVPSRTGTPQTLEEGSYYGGLFNQFTRRMGY